MQELQRVDLARQRVALVLGAGGPVGHAFHAGVLAALQRRMGWDARNASLIVGTSAGAQVAALLRAGMAPIDLLARVTGEAMSAKGAAIAAHYQRGRIPDGAKRKFAPASFKYLGRALTRPWNAQPGRFISALLPEGRVCSRLQIEGLQRLFADRWPSEPTWITAVRLHTGEPIAFGRDGDPRTDVGTAVACSSAVPSIKAPIAVDGDHYVDGGIVSATHLDLLRHVDADLVLVSSPLSRLAPTRMLFRRELRRLRSMGKTVVAFEPTGPTRRSMGLNPLSLDRGPAVGRMAYATTAQLLADPRPRVPADAG